MKYLFDGEYIRVDYNPFDKFKKNIVITFNGRNKKQSKDVSFGYEFCKKNNWSVIAITTSRNTWYQNSDILAAYEKILPILKGYSIVHSYGASMGGYAALHCCKYLPIDVCVSLSPQFSIDSNKVPWDTRWKKEEENITFLHDDISLCKSTRYYIIFDPYHPIDPKHIELIKNSGQAIFFKELRVPFSGHVVFDFSASFLSKHIKKIIDGCFSDYDFSNERRSLRKSSSIYLSNAASVLLSKNKVEISLGLARKGIDIDPRCFECFLILSRIYVRKSAYLDAICAVKEVINLRPDLSIGYRHLSSIYINLEWYEEAYLFIRKALEINPNEQANYLISKKIEDKV